MSSLINTDASEEFLQLVRDSLGDKSFRRLVLAKPRSSIPGSASRLTVREVMIRDQHRLSIVETHTTKDLTRNLSSEDGLAMIRELIGSSFLRAHLIASTGNLDLSISKKGKGVLHRAKGGGETVESAVVVEVPAFSGDATSGDAPVIGHLTSGGVAVAGHDRVKRRFVEQSQPFLRELGVTDESGRVVPSMAKKWKQINKFVEILDGAIEACGLTTAQRVRVLDFGSGRGYLTFALHQHLSSTWQKQASVTGVELRSELVDAANLVVRRVGAHGLEFVCGDIVGSPTAAGVDQLDIMVALHACDIATDIAIHHGIRRGAQVVVCSPCCHKELRPHIKPPDALTPVLRHGVQLGQEAEMLTDTIRALLLEAHGYDAKIFEFVGLEDSSKNKMILGIKRTQTNASKNDRAFAELSALMDFYGVGSQHLKTLLYS